MSLEDRRRKAIAFVSSIPTGAFPDGLLADDFCGWALGLGRIEGRNYLRGVAATGQIFVDGGYRVTIDGTTAEGNCVVVQARGEGALYTGKTYNQTYMFVLEFNDDDEVRQVREYLDVQLMRDALGPAIMEWRKTHPA